MPIPAAYMVGAKVATQLLPLALGLGRKKKKGPNIAALAADYRSRRPEMTLSAEDIAAAGRTRGRITSSAVRSGEMTRMNANRQAIARGLSGTAAAALGTVADAQVAEGREKGALAEADQLYATGKDNQSYDRAKEDRIFGALVGDAQQQAQRNDARDATFWNSMMDLTTATSALWNPQAPVTGTTAPGSSVAATPTAGRPATVSAIPGAPGSRRPPTRPPAQ